MGYMGFGMNKEVYKRKPKTAFEKVKRINAVDYKKKKLVTTAANTKPGQRYERTRYKHFRDTLFYKIIVTVILITIIIFVYILGKT